MAELSAGEHTAMSAESTEFPANYPGWLLAVPWKEVE